jgi:hypothetical protein
VIALMWAMNNQMRFSSSTAGHYSPMPTRYSEAHREIAARLKDAGYCNERGQPFNPQSVRALSNGTGHVHVSWNLVEPRKLKLSWQEAGAPGRCPGAYRLWFTVD